MSKEQASNFELNFIKLGIHNFQLMKGDRFESNGAYFHYIPCEENPNTGKGKHIRWRGRLNYHSAAKYRKDVERADNIELIKDEKTYIDSKEKQHYHKIWEVKYAYTVEIPKPDNIVQMVISLNSGYMKESDKTWEFFVKELEIDRETEKQIIIKGSTINHNSRIMKDELNIVRVRYGYDYYILGRMDDYNDMESKLIQYVENAIHEKIKTAHEIVQRETNNLNKFLLLKSKQGY